MERELQHFSHDHPLIFKSEEHKTDDGRDHSDQIITCDGCSAPISAPFFSCGECPYFLHKECAELPNEMNHPMHPQHPLTLLSSPCYEGDEFDCSRCGKTGMRFVYNCSLCQFDLDPICASAYGYRVRHKTMEEEMTHFSHEHPLILKAEERKIDDGTHHPDIKVISCKGCGEPISSPFYSCAECDYLLHKVCAELPNEMNHPMHPEHPLTLLSKPYNRYQQSTCDMCAGFYDGFSYCCSLCHFDIDMICASTTHMIEDKCHQHPLIPLQLSIPIPCHICRTEEKGFSYKCTICPFWVHQNCTVSLLSSVKNSYHDHPLTLLQYVSLKYRTVSWKCDICYDKLSRFCVYYCGRCMFFAHASCARSRDQSIEINQDLQPNGKHLALLPVQQKSTDLISWFAENYSDRDAITNLVLGFDESFINRDNNIKKEIKFFSHEHPLILIDDQESEVICDACALPISTPSYGCIDCGYFLHKYCTELPKQILHPAHPQHQITLWSYNEIHPPAHPQHPITLQDAYNDRIFHCDCCFQLCNGFGYRCFQCEGFIIDIKCASFLRPVKHEAHKHTLVPKFISSSTCSACNDEPLFDFILQCNTHSCSFSLCFMCAMSPPVMKHRYDEHPFKLTYSPPENHHNYYICDFCEEDLNPKFWFYHCRLCDRFTHRSCMHVRGFDSNIKYGKKYMFEDHEHELTLFSSTHSGSFCDKCSLPMRTGYNVGLECKPPCNFKIHLWCALGLTARLPN